jgi:hypothetical protein
MSLGDKLKKRGIISFIGLFIFVTGGELLFVFGG